MTPGSNFIAGVNDTAEKLFAGVNDNGEKTVLTIRQQYLRPPGSDAAADGVIGTTMKRHIHRHPKPQPGHVQRFCVILVVGLSLHRSQFF
jgi:hypothetical protein